MADAATVPLVALAYGRSGDKGDNANIGIFARKPEDVPILDSEVTEEAVAQYFAHRIKGPVTRWRLPGTVEQSQARLDESYAATTWEVGGHGH